MKVRHKRKYILGEGYPWALGLGNPYFAMQLNKGQNGVVPVPLDWPDELWDVTLPRYRLVLERLSEEKP